MLSNALSQIDQKYSREWMNSHERDAWSIITSNPDGFKSIFSASISNKMPSSQHYQLAELFAIGVVKHIVDFNWDDLVERTHLERIGSPMPKIVTDGRRSNHSVWKQHGDVDNLSERRIFPFEEGRVFRSVKDSVLTERTEKYNEARYFSQCWGLTKSSIHVELERFCIDLLESIF